MARVTDLQATLAEAPHEAGSQILWHAWQSQEIARDELGQHLATVWGRVGKQRYTSLTRAQWRQLYRSAGFTRNGQPAPAPGTLVLYRGASAEYARNWSWTDRLDIAEQYARNQRGEIWTVTPPGSAVLAYRDTPLLNLNEYVVDTDGLDIQPVSLPRSNCS